MFKINMKTYKKLPTNLDKFIENQYKLKIPNSEIQNLLSPNISISESKKTQLVNLLNEGELDLSQISRIEILIPH